MWAYKFARKETRLQVPKYRTFLKQNHDLLKLWYEEEHEASEERVNFLLRNFRFGIYILLIFIFVYTLIDPNDEYYFNECQKRVDCYSGCNVGYFPELECAPTTGLKFIYNGNRFNQFYTYKRPDITKGQTGLGQYDQCKAFISQNAEYPFIQHLNRQARIHTCFSYCINGDDKAIIGETRQYCTDLPPDQRDQIICVYPSETCEQTILQEEVVLGEGVMSLAPGIAIIACFIVTPIQFIFEFLCIILAKLKILALSISFISDTIAYGRPELLFPTMALSIIFDQVKSVGILSALYIIIIIEIPKKEIMIPKLKVFCLKMLESQGFEMISMILISLYTAFILFWLTLADIFVIDEQILSKIDTAFLTIFFTEIILKSFASNFMYLVDVFNAFDACIVLISEVLNIIGIIAKGLGVLRLIRVVVITIRKITGNTSKLRHQSKNLNPVESVIKILQAIIDLREISQSIKKEAKWAKDIIESNKLYELNFDMASEEKNMDVEAKAWLNITTDAANDTTQWFERDLDDFLKEIHRENDEQDPNKLEEEEERIKQILQVPPRMWNNALKMMDDFDKWDFDIFKYSENLGETTILHFGFKLFQIYGLLEKFSIADNNFFNLLTQIRNSFYENNTYHNTLRAIEVTRNFHYFVKHGELMNHLSDLNVMAAFLSCLMHDLGHPGVNNSYLIATKHPKAVRYNDKSVLENHHCAMAFKLLLDPQNDIFELLSEAQYWNVRQTIIKMILATDISMHFDQIMAFRGRLSTKKFPEESNEDKQLILNLVLYASDHANSCKNSIQYFRWMAAEMEEYYQQGDIEKKLGYSVSAFFDRTTCNPFVYQRGYISVIVEPLYLTLLDFLPAQCKQDCWTKGLEENKLLIEQKIEETKNLVNVSMSTHELNLQE
eukprot:403336019